MKVAIIVEGGCVIQVQSDNAACEVEVIDLDSQDEALHDAAKKRFEELTENPEWKVVA